MLVQTIGVAQKLVADMMRFLAMIKMNALRIVATKKLDVLIPPSHAMTMMLVLPKRALLIAVVLGLM
jgi:hypothetical protein